MNFKIIKISYVLLGILFYLSIFNSGDCYSYYLKFKLYIYISWNNLLHELLLILVYHEYNNCVLYRIVFVSDSRRNIACIFNYEAPQVLLTNFIVYHVLECILCLYPNQWHAC